MEGVDHLKASDDVAAWCCRWKDAFTMTEANKHSLLGSGSNIIVNANPQATAAASEAANQQYACEAVPQVF